MKKIKSFGLLILFFSLIACGQETQINDKEKIDNGWKVYAESNYSITYPDYWELDKSGHKLRILFKKTVGIRVECHRYE